MDHISHDELDALMRLAPGQEVDGVQPGDDPGRAVTWERDAVTRPSRNPHTLAALDWLFGDADEGMGQVGHVVSGRAGNGGLTGHRTRLYRDQYLDRARFTAAVEAELGVTAADMRTIYGGRGGGPLPVRLRPMRAAIDARLARIAASGGSLTLVAAAFDLNPRALHRGARRAGGN